MDSPLVEMVVVRVSPYLRENRPLLWLGEKHAEVPRLLAIAIGEFEAAAIQMPLEGEKPGRPISYDLLAAMVKQLGVRVVRVVIESVCKSVFFAKVVLQGEGPARALDSRPSDAVALALRTGAPVFVTRALLEEAGLEPGSSRGDLERFLDRFHELEPQVVERQAAAVTATAVDRDGAQAQSRRDPADLLTELQGRLQRAVICEEYEEAARLRDEIESLEASRRE